MPERHPLANRDVVVPGPAGVPRRLSVAEYGLAGSGPPLVLIHGLPTTGRLWRDVAHELGGSRFCVIPDLLGTGGSERPRDAGAYQLHNQAAALLGLLDVLGLPTVDLAGHDLGGAVAVQLASLAPGRVRSLIVLDAPMHADVWPSPAAFPFLVPGLSRLLTVALTRSPPAGRAVLRRLVGATASPRDLDRLAAELGAEGALAALLQVLAAVDLAPVERALALVSHAGVPALVLWGARDGWLSPAYGRRVTAALGAAFVPILEAGHVLPAQRPERVAEEIAAFLESLPADARDARACAGRRGHRTANGPSGTPHG